MERLLIECAIRSTLIAAAAVVVLACMRIKNVVLRHNAWTSVLVFMLALPLLVSVGHPVPLRVLPPLRHYTEQVRPSLAGTIPFVLPEINSALSESLRGETKPRHLAWMRWVQGIYLFGVGVLLLRVITGAIGARRVKRQAFQLDGHLTSTFCSSPITVGCLHAVTILPEGWQDWEPAKLDAILIHEGEHASRHDPLIQWLALVNRAIFWFHPLSWWLERRLAALSEEACDLAVLERGHPADDYCRYLLDVANSVRASRRRIRLLGMAMPGAYLPQRIQKILNRSQTPKLSFLRMGFAIAVFFFLSASLSTATLVRGETSALPHIEQTGTAVGNVQAQTALVTGQPSVFQEASAPQGPPAVKGEQRNEHSYGWLEQPGDLALVIQRAKDLGFDGDTYVLQQMERWRQARNLPTMEALEQEIVSIGSSLDEEKQKMREAWLTSRVLFEIYRQAEPTDDEIRRYYDAHAQDFNRPAGVHVREITILTNGEPEQIESQRKKAEAALAALKKGDDFGAVAKEFSESTTAQQGGDLGILFKGQAAGPLELEEVVNKLEKGEVSDIIPVEGAFMILKVDDEYPGGVLPFELARNEISGLLFRQAVKPKTHEYLAKLRASGRR